MGFFRNIFNAKKHVEEKNDFSAYFLTASARDKKRLYARLIQKTDKTPR